MRGYRTRVAHIDLNRRRIEFENIDSSLMRKWGGGSGIASWRLYDDVRPGIESLDADNVVWVIAGPLTGTIAPCSGRIEIVTKSALTGLLGLSNTGGQFGARLKQAGLDGLILRGMSNDPVYILVGTEGIELRDASHLWGKDTYETAAMIGSELNDASLKRIKVMAIGPAGENLVRFACPVNERYHTAARGGAGAVLGAKKVKAIAVDAQSLLLPASSAFRAIAERIRRKIKDNPRCQNYSRFGSLSVSDLCVEMGDLPGRNFQTGTLPRWQETRGTAKIRSFVTRPEGSCYRCPMPCFNRVEVQEGKYRGLKITGGTFIQVVLEFGAKCGIESLPAIWKCKEICHRLGMDYGSASGTVSFAMELFQRGVLTEQDTGGLSLTWGNERATMKLLEQMAYRQGLGDVLAEGALRASNVLGPASVPSVMTIKGMEMISQDVRATRRGWSLGSLTSPRGGDNVRGTHMQGDTIPSLSFLRPERLSEWKSYSASFVADLDMFPTMKAAIYGDPPRVDPFTYEGKVLMTKWFEDLFAAINALGLCTFPADKLALGPTAYAELISSFLGEEIEPEEFMEVGERIFTLQRLFNIREGVSRKDDTWPDRFFEERLPEGPARGAVVSRKTIERVLDEYYDARGWDRGTGYPTPMTLSKLGIEGKLVEPFNEKARDEGKLSEFRR
jgi:aldehyde:ferredoxin oxidoreductase